MKMRKQKYFKDMKTIISFTISVILILTAFAGSGCAKGIEADEYPQPSAVETSVSEQPEKTGPVVREEEKMSDEEFAELIAIPDPFERTGTFTLSPAVIPPTLASRYRDKPKIVKNAQYILEAVYNLDYEFEVPVEDTVDMNDFWLAEELAELSNPMVRAADLGMSEDGKYIYVTYLPKIYIVKEEDSNYPDIAIQEREQDEIQAVFDGFTDYVTETVNRNVSREDPDMEKAKAIYKALASDFTPIMENSTSAYIYVDDTMEDGQDISGLSLIEKVNERKLEPSDIALLYQFILTQLNIECMTVRASGNPVKQNVEEFDKFMGSNYSAIWNVVVVDGKAYHCDLFYEISILDYERQFNPAREPDMTFFGMSDATRDKSFEVNKDKSSEFSLLDVFELDTGLKGGIVPVCVEDYMGQ